jgi:predicted HicB family RNase H-like nuclease
MSNVMSHKGYSAKVEYSEEDECFIVRIAGIRAIVGFHGNSVTALKRAFHTAVDNYIALAKERGEEPEKPFSGRMMLRLPSQLHARVNQAAERSGLSVNQWAAKALEQASQT